VKDAKTVLEEFYDIAESRCAFLLENGDYYEGYIIAIDNGHLRFCGGGPMAAVEPLLIPVQDVDLLSLAYWDKRCECYMDAKWDDAQDKWVFQPSQSVNQQSAASSTSNDTPDLGLP
jgi:hypothetical protein